MPLSWVMGVPWEHCEDVATLIGLKVVVNEMVAYQRLGEFKEQGKLSDRSELIATFAICGFANPGSIGILIGGLSSLAPEKKRQIAAVAVRAFFSGTAVCLLTASIAGKVVILNVTVCRHRSSRCFSRIIDQAALCCRYTSQRHFCNADKTKYDCSDDIGYFKYTELRND